MSKRVAIITGGARGIGRAIAVRLAHDGFVVAVADVDESSAGITAAEIARTFPGQAFAATVDVANSTSARQLMEAVLAREGRIDVLVNNAGIVGPTAKVVDYSDEAWRRVLSINLDGTFYCSRAVLPHMIARSSGRIVNIASISGKEGNANMPAYSSSKAGVIGFTKALAKEVVTHGIFVNCVTPSLIETDIVKDVAPETVAVLISKVPLGRLGQPQEVAALVAWLASDECSFSTGAVFDISGGRATY